MYPTPPVPISILGAQRFVASRGKLWARFLVFGLITTLLLPGCVQWAVRRDLARSPGEDPGLSGPSSSRKAYLMAHMTNGEVYVFDTWWREGPKASRIAGLGRVRDADRHLVREGKIAISVDSVALFETNAMISRVHPAVVVGAIAITAVAVAAAVGKREEPPPPPPPSETKSGYGSCPTFYVTDGTRRVLRAEGFSASVARILEAQDVDALYGVRPLGRELEVVMKNEALETHVIRHVNVLAARRPVGGRVFAAPDGSYWQAPDVVEASRCLAPEGDCRAALQELDGIERFCPADSNDLAARETLEVEFAQVPEGRWGLVVASRQALLGTFLFYRALAYLGRSAGTWLAVVERGDPVARMRSEAIWRALGGIEVSVAKPGGGWEPAGEINETGPLATDVRVLPLAGETGGSVRIRLRLARGQWRLDQVGLARLERAVEPVRLSPFLVRRGSVVDESARKALCDSTATLVTLPGDEYALVYRLPEDFDAYELFLETRGYYYEWIREEWLAEEDPARAALMLFRPDQALREMAPEYKRVEKRWEAEFWNSRYGRH